MRGIRKDSSSALAEPVARSERRLRTGEEATPRRDDIAAEAELVGLFQYGDLLRNRPRTLATWRVIAPRGCTVDRIAQLLGGDPQHDHKSGQAEVITESAAVGILLSGAGALRVRWEGVDKRACDGAAEGDDRRCTCPPTLAERRAAAKLGLSCQPRAEIRFRLQDDPALGLFSLVSEDWSFVEHVMASLAVLRRTNGPAAARLNLLRTMHPLRSGRVLAYTRPAISLLEREP
jgi:hypothetical protein